MRRSELSEYIKETIVELLSEDTAQELEDTQELTQAVKDLQKAKEEAGLTEDIDDKEAVADPNDSVAQVANKIQKTIEKRLAVLDKWKKAEGKEKEELLDRLKALSKTITDLEKLL